MNKLRARLFALQKAVMRAWELNPDSAVIVYYVLKEWYGSQEYEKLGRAERKAVEDWYYEMHAKVGRYLPFQSQPWPSMREHQHQLQHARDFVRELEELGGKNYANYAEELQKEREEHGDPRPRERRPLFGPRRKE